MMKAIEIQQRRQRILNILNQEHKISVQALVEKLQVSDETVRKDLAVLADQGLVHKNYGVAELVTSTPPTPVRFRDKTENRAKIAISRLALSLIKPEMRFIGLDQGSSVAKLAEVLNQLQHKTIITRSLLSLIALKDGDNEFFCPGGYYNASDMAFQGQNEAFTVANTHLDISFFGSSGVKNRPGLCSSSFTDAEFKKQMVEQSSINVALVDHTKFEQTALVMVLPWSRFDYLITDAQTPPTVLKQLKNQVKIMIAH